MANNCLITKLKGVVDNPNLPILGAFRLEGFGIDKTITIAPVSGKTIAMICEGVETIISSSTQVTIEANKIYQFNKAEDIMYIDVRSFGEDYTGNRSLVAIGVPTTYGTLGEIVTTVKISGYHIDGKMMPQRDDAVYGIDLMYFNPEYDSAGDSMFNWLKTHQLRRLSAVYQPYLDTMTKAAQVGIPGSKPSNIQLSGNVGSISGTIEDFITQRRLEGQSSGTVYFPYLGALEITFNGVKVTNNSLDRVEVSWTATTMTCNGVTINA